MMLMPRPGKSGDLRSIGLVDEAVAIVLARPELFGELVAGLADSDRLVRMRSADAVEKVTRKHADWLASWKRYLLQEAAAREEKELRWHVAQLQDGLPQSRFAGMTRASAR